MADARFCIMCLDSHAWRIQHVLDRPSFDLDYLIYVSSVIREIHAFEMIIIECIFGLHCNLNGAGQVGSPLNHLELLTGAGHANQSKHVLVPHQPCCMECM